MPNLSSIIGGGGTGTPIGSIVRMPGNTVGNSFTDGSASYLRCGVLTPYISPTHDKVASLGFKYSKGALQLNTTGLLHPFQTYESIATGKFPNRNRTLYCKGEWGTISEVSPKLWLFRSLYGTVGQTSTVMVKEPADYTYSPATTNTAPLLEARTAPAWMESLSCWVIAETRDAYMATNIKFNKVVFLTSVDGVNWMESTKVTLTNAQIHPNAGGLIGLTCVGNFLLISSRNETAGVNEINIFEMQSDRYNVGNYLTTGNTNLAITPVSNVTINVVSITKDSAIISWHTGPSPYTPNVYHFHKSGSFKPITGSFTTNTVASHGLQVVRNNSEVLFMDTGASQCYRIPLVNGLLSTDAATFADTTSLHTVNATGNGFIKWTGAYWVYSYTGTNLNGFAYSVNGTTWTTPISSNASGYASGQYVGSSTKNHVNYYNGTSALLYNMVSGTTSNVYSYSASGTVDTIPNQIVTLNGYNVRIYNNCMIARSDSNGIEEIVYSSSSNSFNVAKTFNTNYSDSYLKVVNGKIFVINNISAISSLIYSSDGSTWASLALPANIGNIVTDVEFVGSNWVIATNGDTAGNAFYTSDFVALTPVTAGGSAGTAVNKLVKTGTALIALSNSVSGNKRSIDGITWSTMTGMGNTGTTMAAVYDSTTLKTYVSYWTTGGTHTLYTSTDDGLNWASSTAYTPCPGYGLSELTAFNGKIYSRCFAGNEAIFSTTDLTTWTQVSTVIPQMAGSTGTYFSRIYVINNSLRYRAIYSNTASVYEQVVDSTTGVSLVGTDRPIIGDGTVGFMRIS